MAVAKEIDYPQKESFERWMIVLMRIIIETLSFQFRE